MDRQRNSRSEAEVLRARGARIFMLKSARDREGLEQLKKILVQTDVHVILGRLLAKELTAVQALLRERKNFSIMVDDWWSMPHWFLRSAEYILFRN